MKLSARTPTGTDSNLIRLCTSLRWSTVFCGVAFAYRLFERYSFQRFRNAGRTTRVLTFRVIDRSTVYAHKENRSTRFVYCVTCACTRLYCERQSVTRPEPNDLFDFKRLRARVCVSISTATLIIIIFSLCGTGTRVKRGNGRVVKPTRVQTIVRRALRAAMVDDEDRRRNRARTGIYDL